MKTETFITWLKWFKTNNQKRVWQMGVRPKKIKK
jgi:hypothetical protein